ncbi:prolipoprotein diacylglyceryl transferase [Nibricoccus aquaticus]|uniref:Phosphatidylglycerol--prolipoprotein diacylglyceryl transferase n=1 Tax=Nibricoccus aquaticus TaxID=2576891 RepID=A0A290Q5P8_9BACT|nr:prolipoprotein diacylglyceryl transferase [Nibricoccus aquaticus]ATC62490.1 prolipoprotein diacylglyceryl transferase [Nibricoccus aquaticus]
MLTLAHWTHDLSPFVPFLQFSETRGVRWYGLAYVLGFVCALWLLHRYTRTGRSRLTTEQNGDLLLIIVIGVMLGGRLGSFLLYHPELLLSDPLSFFRIWEGGMASHGAFIGVTLALIWFSRKTKVSFLHLGDLITSTAALGLMLGRIANFINGELWGKESTVRWAVIFVNTDGGPMPRHPSQLYQALLEGALLFAYMQHRVWKNRVLQTHPGQLSGEFLIGYSIMRVIGEVFREPDASLVWNTFSRGTFYSFFVFIAGVALILFARRQPQRG